MMVVRPLRVLAVVAAATLLLAPTGPARAQPPPPAWEPPVVTDTPDRFRTLPAPDDTEPPSPPGRPEASQLTPNSLRLSWSPASDNVGVVGYDVFRTRPDGQVVSAAHVVAVDDLAPAWQFQRLLPDHDYDFHVVAFDAAGNRSAASEPLPVRTPADPRGACEVAYTATALGAGLVEGLISLAYDGPYVDVWTLRFRLPGGQELEYGPLPGWAQTGTEVVAWYEGWADLLGPGERVWSFTATGAVSDPSPVDFSLNGQTCTVR